MMQNEKTVNVISKDVFDFDQWKESKDREFKLAAGKDGKGALPDSVWETYSAMANTVGGTIFLGVKEFPDLHIEIQGVANPEKVVKEFWNQVNNPQKVSNNLLVSDNVTQFQFEGKTLIAINVPRATRKERPVYIGTNPFTGTFRRQNDGDYRCPSEVVQRMIAEKSSDTLDAEICNHYSIDDIDAGTLTAYRQTYLALRMTSLLPEEVVAAASTLFGERFGKLPSLERLAVVTALAEDEVSHSRLMELCTDHQADISSALRNLVHAKMLYSEGYGRGTVYHVIKQDNGDENVNNAIEMELEGKGPSSAEKGPSSAEKGSSSTEKGPSSAKKGPSSAEPSPNVAVAVLNKGKRECLMVLLGDDELSATTLRSRLNRNNATKFRRNILAPLIKLGFVELVLQPPQHPKQKYRITATGRDFMANLAEEKGKVSE